MEYRLYGRSGRRISQLGFGAMRLPKGADGGLDMDQSVAVMRQAFDSGVNYVDSAYGYGAGLSEVAVGEAVAGRRGEVFISTKIPVHSRAVDLRRWREHIEEQLRRLKTDYIDFWHFHDLKNADFEERVMVKGGLMETVQRAREEGLLRHICLSSHEPPEITRKYLDTGCFDGLTIQYNILNLSNAGVIAHAHAKGIGVVVMGPVGGGRLAQPSRRLAEAAPGHVKSFPELAIRFVLSNPNVTCALSGMNTPEMVAENCAAASHTEPLSAAESERIRELSRELRRLADLYCTGCGYCLPCPQNVDIPGNFELMNQFRVYGFEEAARAGYAALGRRDQPDATPYQQTHLRASECTGCGACRDKCPQKIDIPEQLKEVAKTLASR